ncbi:hypothetical protein Tco_1359759 [Tanacetum coccineum]
MTRSTVKRLTEPLDEPEREFRRLRRAALRSHQNESLAIVKRNLFDDEASLSNNTGPKPPTLPKTLHEHSHPTSSGFQNPITIPTKQTRRIINSRDIWLIQNACTFLGLRTEDPLRHVKHYLSIVDNIQADGAIRDTSRLYLTRRSLEVLRKFHWMILGGRFNQLSHGEGSTVLVESHHTPTSAPSTSQPPTSSPSMQRTHVVEEAATMPHDLPLPRVHSLRSNEGSMTLHELTVLCTTLSKKVESLESDLKQTKLTYGAAYTKFIMKVKKLENRIKSSKARRRVRLIVSEDEVQMGAQTKGRHEHDLEPDFEFTAPKVVYTAETDISTTNVPVSIAGAEVSTASPEVKTAAESLVYIRRSAAKRKDKGKAIMKEVEPVQKKTKLQLEQERLGYEEALRLQEQLDEEERQRITRVHKESGGGGRGGQRQKIGEGSEPDEESKDKLSQEQLQQLMIIVPEEGMNRLYQIFKDMLKNFDRDDLVKLWSLFHERFNSIEPTEGKERELWVELKRLFELDDDYTLWKLQMYMHDPLKWRLYDTCAIHHVSTERGHDIFMLVEKDYLLTRAFMTLMLSNKAAKWDKIYSDAMSF